MYHIATFSPFRMLLPPSSVSLSAVRRMWATGVCQRMISGTTGEQLGIGAQLAVLVGFLFSAIRPPVIELRVVSLPPTISSRILPRNSMAGGMSRVASPCASIEIRSFAGGSCARSSHSP